MVGLTLATNRSDLSITSKEYLYNNSGDHSYSSHSRALLPVIGAGYSVPISGMFEISLNTLYGPNGIQLTSDEIKYNSKGWRLGMGFSFNIYGA